VLIVKYDYPLDPNIKLPLSGRFEMDWGTHISITVILQITSLPLVFDLILPNRGHLPREIADILPVLKGKPPVVVSRRPSVDG
jgi:hypothetical protein